MICYALGFLMGMGVLVMMWPRFVSIFASSRFRTRFLSIRTESMNFYNESALNVTKLSQPVA